VCMFVILCVKVFFEVGVLLWEMLRIEIAYELLSIQSSSEMPIHLLRGALLEKPSMFIL
jgi:hypothetical protein